MKKLMTVLASAATALCAVGAWADFTETSTDFEGLNVGQAFDSNNGMDGYWVGASDAELFISNHTDTISVSRPDFDRSNSNTNYLAIESSVTRGLKEMSGTAFPGVEIPADGIYLDTLVKFTAADEVFGEDALASGDKIAIEYVAQGDDVDNPITNFVIRAGKTVEGSLVSANYLAAVPKNFDVNAWHRLTVRVIDNVGNGQVGQVGFVIYLDGDVNKLLAYDTNVDAGFGELNPTAQKFYNENLHALYPSAVDSQATGGSAIASATFSGTGCIDDVVFTTTTPGFIQQGEAVSVPFVADAGVTAISVTVAGVADPIPVVDGSATLPAQTTAFTVNVTVDEAHGYTFGSITVGETAYDTNPASVTDYAGDTITITTIRNNFNLFDENGVAIEGTFQTLTEALAEDDVARIALAWNYQVTAEEAASEKEIYSIEGKIVLDLNGKTLDGGEGNGFELFYVTGSLKVIDSVGGGKIVYGGNVFGSEGSLRVGDVNGDNGVTIDGVLFNAVAPGYVIRANVLAEGNTDEGAFLWTLGDGEDIESEATLVGDYWVVTPQGGSTTFALTTTGGANATVTTSPANVSALTEETEVTITATAAQDYTYDDVDLTGTDWTYDPQADAISMTTNISENTTVVVPDAVSEQSSDDWPTGQDLIEAEGKAAEDLFPGITNALATADAKAVATWAEAKGVAYADKGSILPEAFLLNCANTQAAIDEAAANFKVTAITVAGDTVTITPADGADYGNGKVVIEGTATLSPISWHEKTDGDHFFRATLVVKPVAVP